MFKLNKLKRVKNNLKKAIDLSLINLLKDLSLRKMYQAINYSV